MTEPTCPAFTVGGAGNPNLKPEKSTESEAGLDLGLFSDRLNIEYTHYNKITRDALVNVNLAPSLGTSTNRFQNLGRVRNLGDELVVRAALLNRDRVKLDLLVNGSWTKNNLDDLGVDENGVADSAVHRRFRRHANLQDRSPARRVLHPRNHVGE